MGLLENATFMHGSKGVYFLLGSLSFFLFHVLSLASVPSCPPTFALHRLQLLESGAAPLLATEFPTLVDLILQTFDDGPGDGAVPLYLQVLGRARLEAGLGQGCG